MCKNIQVQTKVIDDYAQSLQGIISLICDAHLTSFRYELCSGMKPCCRVWIEAVAEVFSEWRALMSWLRGTIIWQIHKQRKNIGQTQI